LLGPVWHGDSASRGGVEQIEAADHAAAGKPPGYALKGVPQETHGGVVPQAFVGPLQQQ
jgi:hypothetical protein